MRRVTLMTSDWERAQKNYRYPGHRVMIQCATVAPPLDDDATSRTLHGITPERKAQDEVPEWVEKRSKEVIYCRQIPVDTTTMTEMKWRDCATLFSDLWNAEAVLPLSSLVAAEC